MEYILNTRDLAVGYDKRPLLQNITFSVRQGEILTLIGPNGAGKSTILKSITRQLKTMGGAVFLGKQPMDSLKEDEIARQLSILITNRVEPELMTCEDIVAAGRYPYTGRLGILSPHDWAKVEEAMNLVHVEELRERDFGRISDGQRQRVMLARAICQEPKLLVLDEPTSFLDIRHKLELLSILKKLVREKGVGVIMTLHELDLAQKCSDHILCVGAGQVERYGTPDEIFSGGYIEALYGVERGSYNDQFGCLELEKPVGEPQVFVIGGGGYGIPVYRQLQRLGIPFAVGVLSENDLDYPVAKALAMEVISVPAFEAVSPESVRRALCVLERCEKVMCPLPGFGYGNAENKKLLLEGKKQGKLVDCKTL